MSEEKDQASETETESNEPDSSASEAVSTVSTDMAINETLDNLDTGTLQAIVKKLRGENAKARVDRKEARDILAKIQEEKDLADSTAKRQVIDLTRKLLAIEFNIKEDLVEFIGEDSPDKMRERAEKLSKGGSAASEAKADSYKPTDMFAGRKAPAPKTMTGGELLRSLIQGN